MAIYPKRPGIDLNGISLNTIAHHNLLVTVIPGKDAHLTFGRRLKAEIEGNKATTSMPELPAYPTRSDTREELSVEITDNVAIMLQSIYAHASWANGKLFDATAQISEAQLTHAASE